MQVLYCSESVVEMSRLPPSEQAAMLNAIEKLVTMGDRLPYPHSSAVKDSKVRELRPRSGNSPWRAFYRRFGNWLVIGAIGPEAAVDPAGFRRAVAEAASRLGAVEAERR